MKLMKAETTEHFNKIRNLYQASFPRCEKKPFRLIKYKQRKKMSDIWYLQNDDNEFVGLAITMNAKDMVLLDYFAIAEEMRGKGIGSEALQILKRYYSDKRFFLEIESTVGQADNQTQREQRKKFYLRNGMSEIGILANVFGTDMELLGDYCRLDFDEYVSVYRTVYGNEKAGHLRKLE